MKLTALVLLLTGFGCGETEGASSTAAVSQDFDTVDGLYEINTGHDSLTDAVGVIRHIEGIDVNGYTPVGGNCAVTFVSQHFAVTAAHCVEDLTTNTVDLLPPGWFWVEQIEVADPTTPTAASSGAVSGTWPSWTTGSSYSEPTGYDLVREGCFVRCNGDAPDCASSVSGIDIALIECPNRSVDYWAAIRTVPEQAGDLVEVRWFHEYLDLPTSGIGDERYERYQRYFDVNSMNGVFDDNFHYTEFDHLYWPMKSDVGFGGVNPAEVVNPTVTGPGFPPGSFSADFFGCHGQSGAGVFQRGSTALIGPVSFATSPGLCDAGLNSVKQQYTVVLANLPYVSDDRNGIYP